ncbi:hypothetical protein GBP88_01955 [Mycobacterium avium subsp. hominissuis]|uniref:Uncharacterized protein n=1 Tax=Mycobacterium bouchedurhonense TaxID=701041 RepID=A0ABX3SJB2_MYCBC|nr:hypothetical protein [Mycobacterium avium subsp. hominissuis]ORA57420.1 hypothetical protein BST19_02210 [Mycobacterium bouchedurhonense]PBA14238.1 hypothetical protein CKJ69_17120 [Mycobacterium avium]TXA42902.1 hypothetical protein DKM27_04430 [Mycobacterium tuberculosis variant bovis]MBZ4504717.1 hypothetical protein [Mycobacterium avium subsp. hominissuis]
MLSGNSVPHAKDDDGYYHCFQEIEQLVRGRLADGQRHRHETALKERRRTGGHPAHTAAPGRLTREKRNRRRVMSTAWAHHAAGLPEARKRPRGSRVAGGGRRYAGQRVGPEGCG